MTLQVSSLATPTDLAFYRGSLRLYTNQSPERYQPYSRKERYSQAPRVALSGIDLHLACWKRCIQLIIFYCEHLQCQIVFGRESNHLW